MYVVIGCEYNIDDLSFISQSSSTLLNWGPLFYFSSSFHIFFYYNWLYGSWEVEGEPHEKDTILKTSSFSIPVYLHCIPQSINIQYSWDERKEAAALVDKELSIAIMLAHSKSLKY